MGNNAFARNHILISNTIESIIGIQNLEYSYKFADHWTIGVNVTSPNHAKNNNIELNGSSFGGITRYYYKPAYQDDSWYLMAAANKSNYEASINSNGTRYTGKGEDSIVAGGGYHWFWDNFNMSVGASISSQSKITLKDAAGNKYKDEFNPNLVFEIKMGGSF